MIKGRSPFPFETIGLAVSFAPGLQLLVEETKRLCELHGAMALFIHVGKKTSEKQRELSGLLSSNGFNDTNSRIYWEPADTIASVLRICKQEVVDLLIVGASDKSDLNLPVGETASILATKAKCSVLIYTHKNSGSFKNLLISGAEHKKTDLTILTAIFFAEKEHSDMINIIDENEQDDGDLSLTTTEIRPMTMNGALEKSPVKVNYISLSRENCNSVCDYAFRNQVDLLITYSSDHHLMIFDRIGSSNGIETLLKETPCSMLIVHSRIND